MFLFKFNLDSLESYIKVNLLDSNDIDDVYFYEDSVFVVTIINNSTIGKSYQSIDVPNICSDSSEHRTNYFFDLFKYEKLAKDYNKTISFVIISNFEYQRVEFLFYCGATNVNFTFPILIFDKETKLWESKNISINVNKSGEFSRFELGMSTPKQVRD